MKELLPAVISALMSTLILLLVYGYLWLSEKNKAMRLWFVAWIFSVLRYVFMIHRVVFGSSPVFLLMNQWSVLWSVFFLLWGSYVFTERKFPPLFFILTLLNFIWIPVAIFAHLGFHALTFPTFLFLGVVNVFTGYVLIRHTDIPGFEKWLVGLVFILWGLHRWDYPFLADHAGFATFGFYLGALFGLLSAIGMILLYNRKARLEIVQAREEIRRNAEKYRDLIENANEAILVVQDEYVKFCNPQSSVISGYSIDRIQSFPFTKFVYPDDRAMIVDRYSRYLTGEKLENEFEFRILDREENTRWVLIKPVLIQWEGKPAILSFITDISKRKREEAKRIRVEEQLRKAQKLESIGRLAGGIAHDFNNMLTPIIGYAEMISHSDNLSSGDIQHMAQEILGAADTAKRLTQQLLAYGRKQTLIMHIMNLNDTIQGFSRILRRVIRENIVIDYQLSMEKLFIKADISQIEQVLLNLAVNAQDALPDGGTVTVETKKTVLDKEEEAFDGDEEIPPGEYTHLIITDNGWGISPEVMPQIFEPFYSTKKSGEGAGLGLATVYGIVKQHAGYIRVESEEHQFSRFHVYFPLTSGRIIPPPQESHADLVPLATAKRILICEDEEKILNLLTRYLIKMGFEVTATLRPKEAIKLLKEAPEPFHLLITDIIMPEMQGLDLYKALRKKQPNLRVIFISGYSFEVISRKEGIIDNDNFLQKPFSLEELKKLLDDILGNGTA